MENLSDFARAVLAAHYFRPGESTMRDVARRVSRAVFSAVPAAADLVAECEELIAARVFLPGGRYLYAAGRPAKYINNCFLLRAEDTREGWADLLAKTTSALMTGGGVGVTYSALRAKGSPLLRMGGEASGPLPLMRAVDAVGHGIRQGGSRRAAIGAWLHWDHPDALEFVRCKDWSRGLRALKDAERETWCPLEYTNVSIVLDDDFFEAHAAGNPRALEVYGAAVRRMLKTGEPGFHVALAADGGEDLRNPCGEVSSRDDSDVCCLGSVNLARVGSPADMARAVEVASAFLVAGTVYSDVPYPRVDATRTKNRRLGLGLMGLHEWMLQRGKPYAATPDLHPWLDAYAESGAYARKYADAWSLSRPVKTRAVAPTGTIGIVAETTTGCEPVFCRAYRRRWYEGEDRREELVVDPTARRAVASGLHPDDVEDAYAIPVDRRLGVQAWLQRWVDHAISSTVNLPAWGSPGNCESTLDGYARTLLGHLPSLRGVTCYPDGARGGQPLERVSWAEACVGRAVVADACSLRGVESCGG